MQCVCVCVPNYICPICYLSRRRFSGEEYQLQVQKIAQNGHLCTITTTVQYIQKLDLKALCLLLVPHWMSPVALYDVLNVKSYAYNQFCFSINFNVLKIGNENKQRVFSLPTLPSCAFFTRGTQMNLTNEKRQDAKIKCKVYLFILFNCFLTNFFRR